MGVPDHLTCPLRNLYAGQKVTELELDMEQWNNFKIRKGVWQGCILSPCLFNLYAKYYLFGVAQLCLTLCDPVICSPPGFSVHGISAKNTGVGCHSLLQGIFPTQESNLVLLHCRQILYRLSHQRSLYAKSIMWSAGLDESQTAIKIAGRNINNLSYVDDATLMAYSEEEPNSLLMRLKDESKNVAWNSTFIKFMA